MVGNAPQYLSKKYSKLLLSCLGCPIEPIQGSSQLVREVFNWSKESFVIAKRGNVLPCVRALSLPLTLTLSLPASYPGNWLLLLHSLIPPTHRLSQFLFTFASILRITVIMPVWVVSLVSSSHPHVVPVVARVSDWVGSRSCRGALRPTVHALLGARTPRVVHSCV